MRKIIISEFVSLDGVMQAPGGPEEDTEGGFTRGGWTHPYWDDEIGVHFNQVMSESDAFLLGRKTWQIHGGAFEPMAEGDPFGDVMNAASKYVVSNTLTSADAWRNSTLIHGDEHAIVEAARALKAQSGKNILIDGSSMLVHTLARHGLIDEYYLLVYPLALGGGKRVFADGTPLNLRLVEARPLSSGVVLTHYTVERMA